LASPFVDGSLAKKKRHPRQAIATWLTSLLSDRFAALGG
jgi:hypothetical protein